MLLTQPAAHPLSTQPGAWHGLVTTPSWTAWCPARPLAVVLQLCSDLIPGAQDGGTQGLGPMPILHAPRSVWWVTVVTRSSVVNTCAWSGQGGCWHIPSRPWCFHQSSYWALPAGPAHGALVTESQGGAPAGLKVLPGCPVPTLPLPSLASQCAVPGSVSGHFFLEASWPPACWAVAWATG